MRIAVVTLSAALLASVCGPACAQAITGAGSTLAQPIYAKWAEAAAADTGITLNYQGVGSGAGQKLIFAHTVDFGASDAPLSRAKLAEHKLLQFPTVIGAVDIAVNIPGIATNTLRLTGTLVAEIYLGTITNWNDPRIAAINPGLKLPDLQIAPVYRADGSGTTYVFTGYLSKVDDGFKQKVGVDKSVSWPAGSGAKGTAGVASTVKSLPGGIGYVESAYAILNKLTTAQLQNHDGEFVKPALENFVAAATGADWHGSVDEAVDINDQPGKLSWPIVTATYVLLPRDGDAAQRAAVLKFFGWALDHGDSSARGLEYIPLPDKVKDDVRAAWGKLGQGS
jgi:phosphate transport system substrate-binding protein